MKKEIPFDTLMDYADGRLDAEAAAAVALFLETDPESRELVAGLRGIYAKENMGAAALRTSFEKAEARIEKRLQTRSEVSDHVIEVNRYLRRAAAIFALVATFPLLIKATELGNHDFVAATNNGPYELAGGSKIAP